MDLESLKQIIVEVKNVDKNSINENTEFVKDLNLDSIELFQIIMQLEEKCNIKIENDDLLKIKTIKDALEIISKYSNG